MIQGNQHFMVLFPLMPSFQAEKLSSEYTVKCHCYQHILTTLVFKAAIPCLFEVSLRGGGEGGGGVI